MKVPISMHINRANTGSGDQMFITIEDEDAGVQVFRAYLSPEAMMLMLTGRSMEFEAEFCHTDKIGKKKVSEQVQAVCPYMGYEKSCYQQWLIENKQEEGWYIDTYLGSQSSITHNKDETVTLRYSRFKWVEK